MKKFLVVLLIAVLAVGSLFAADITVKGKVKAGIKFDFSTPEKGGYDVDWTFNKVTISVDTGKGGVTGSEKPYAEVEAEISLQHEVDKQNESYFKVGKDLLSYDIKLSELNLKAVIKLTKAEIVTKSFTIDLLHQNVGANYATNVIDYSLADKNDKTESIQYSYGLSGLTKKIPGFTVHTYGYDVGFGVWHKGGDEGYTNVITGVQTPEYKLSDELVARVALGVLYDTKLGDKKVNFGGSVKFGYSTDNLKATVTSDMGYASGVEGKYVKDTKEGFNFDVALATTIYPVDLDVYFAGQVAYKAPNAGNDGFDSVGTVDNLMSVKMAFNLDRLVKDIPLTVSIKAHNLLNNKLKANFESANPFIALALLLDEEELTDLFFARSIDVDVTTKAIPDTEVTVYAHDLMNKYYTATIGAKVENKSIENVTINAEGSYTLGSDEKFLLDSEQIEGGGKVALGVKVANIADIFDAYVKGGVTFGTYGIWNELREFGFVDGDYAVSDYNDDMRWGVACGVSTDKIVQNATLKAEFNWSPDVKSLTGSKGKSMFVGAEISF